MGLSCECGGDYDWYYTEPNDFSTLTTKRSRKCCSCEIKIKVGDTVGSFDCWRPPRSDYEERRFGDEIPMADKYMCEECTGLFFSLTELGFCVTLGSNMRNLAKEYGERQDPPND